MPDGGFRAGAAMTDLTPDLTLPNYNGQPMARFLREIPYP